MTDDFEPKNDTWYYGPIPSNCTRSDLVSIMARAIVLFKRDQHDQCGVSDSIVQCVEILDLWFEHDAEGDDNFDHLVPEEKFEKFQRRVARKAQRILDAEP